MDQSRAFRLIAISVVVAYPMAEPPVSAFTLRVPTVFLPPPVNPNSLVNKTIPNMRPVPGGLLSAFGRREDPFSRSAAFHPGVDLAAPLGSAVHAAADGVVLSAGVSNGYGKLVVIAHVDGVTTWYAHLSKIEVIAGQPVRCGQVLGFSGRSGRVTSPHLHFEVRKGDLAVDPTRYLVRSPVLDVNRTN